MSVVGLTVHHPDLILEIFHTLENMLGPLPVITIIPILHIGAVPD
ncbi:hypothetical protein Ocin01_06568 [Orchesella cincta]|uniref:Uncharacterized protein n=1 Tax=Orchesella cincta TaxID=48709 RepID=A0A1D2N4B4_ORCCI|nr:hypothetical protein Ocin01_06568 [Orchesella cincta]